MKVRKIKIANVDDVRTFIASADKCEFDIDVYYNHIALDGKSIMALLGMDLSKPFTVKYQGDDSHFESVISKLAIC